MAIKVEDRAIKHLEVVRVNHSRAHGGLDGLRILPLVTRREVLDTSPLTFLPEEMYISVAIYCNKIHGNSAKNSDASTRGMLVVD